MDPFLKEDLRLLAPELAQEEAIDLESASFTTSDFKIEHIENIVAEAQAGELIQENEVDMIRKIGGDFVDEILSNSEVKANTAERLGAVPELVSDMINTDPSLHPFSRQGVKVATVLTEIAAHQVVAGQIKSPEKEKAQKANDNKQRAREMVRDWGQAREVNKPARSREAMSTSPKQTRKRRERFELKRKRRQKVYKQSR